MKIAALIPFAYVVLALGACASLRPATEHYAATAPDPLPPVESANGAIYQVGHDVPLFENSVAHRVGDILTILLSEKTDAAKSATTSTAKNNKLALPGPTLLGRPVTINGTEILNNSLDNSSSFDGSGDSKQSNALSGYVTVTVAQRLPNGNLLVRGEKNIMINQGTEFVRIEGIVRPVDISPANTVPSYKVANASISYGSRGAINAANTKSWLARFFDSKWMPF
jgi:flagellar L-ring protein precursor FlgH